MQELILLPFIKAVCLVSVVIGVLIGLGLLFRPQLVISINNFFNAWVSTRKLARPLEKLIDSTAWILKARFICGVFFILISLILAILSLTLY